MQEGDRAPIGERVWGDAQLAFPEGRFENVLTGEKHESSGKIPLAKLLATFPVALLTMSG
jgi:maltooligosyltrehalose synthase